MNNEQNVELHLHTDAYYNGIGDACQKVTEAVDMASQKGATAVAITDHGNCANWVDFFNYARGGEVDHQTLGAKGLSPVKPILGVEAYIGEVEKMPYADAPEKLNRMHCILLVKDYKGYQQVSRFVTETNRHRDKSGRPIGTEDMLRQFFGEDPGHVVCMSACVGGVLATPMTWNYRVEHALKVQRDQIARTTESLGKEYTDAKALVESVDAKVASLTEEKKRAQTLAKKVYGKRRQSLKKLSDEDRAKEEARIEAEEAETEAAKVRLVELREAIKAEKADASYKEAKNTLTKAKARLNTIAVCEERIRALTAGIKSDEELMADVTERAKRYRDIFGTDFYIELQYHGIDREAFVFPRLAKIAQSLGIGTTMTNDVHMAEKNDLLKLELNRNAARLSGNWMSAQEGDSELYFKTTEEKAAMLRQIVSDDVIEQSIANVNRIADECNLDALSEGKHYPNYADADSKLRELATTGRTIVINKANGQAITITSPNIGIEARYGAKWDKAHADRFNYELSVIGQMGFSSYFLFITDVLLKCKTMRPHATDIGPGRGSGAGSIVCYLCGITELDPIEHGLLFERFLNPERVSMPKQYWAFHVNPITQGC